MKFYSSIFTVFFHVQISYNTRKNIRRAMYEHTNVPGCLQATTKESHQSYFSQVNFLFAKKHD